MEPGAGPGMEPGWSQGWSPGMENEVETGMEKGVVPMVEWGWSQGWSQGSSWKRTSSCVNPSRVGLFLRLWANSRDSANNFTPNMCQSQTF